MTKLIKPAVTAVLCCFVLTSCGSAKTADKEQKTVQTEKPAVVTAEDSGSGTDDVTLEHMPFYDGKSGYASEVPGGVCNAYEVDESTAADEGGVRLIPLND